MSPESNNFWCSP